MQPIRHEGFSPVHWQLSKVWVCAKRTFKEVGVAWSERRLGECVHWCCQRFNWVWTQSVNHFTIRWSKGKQSYAFEVSEIAKEEKPELGGWKRWPEVTGRSTQERDREDDRKRRSKGTQSWAGPFRPLPCWHTQKCATVCECLSGWHVFSF